MSYYADKLSVLARLFGTEEVHIEGNQLYVGTSIFDIVDDVIVTLPPHLRPGTLDSSDTAAFARDIQDTFGREWQRFSDVLPEQRKEFDQYFDLIDLDGLSNALVCDLGAGMGRWSWFLAPYCDQLVLADFSDAIFVARQNLRHVSNAIYVMADITDLPFGRDAFDLTMCLGVLHTLGVDPVQSVRTLERLSPRLLVYLMYAVDNRPIYYRFLLRAVTLIRSRTALMTNEPRRRLLATFIAYAVYKPLIVTGRIAKHLSLDRLVPLADDNDGKSMEGIRQVVYDRFFTPIEHRVSLDEILTLRKTFSDVRISDRPPFWHFECRR